MQVATKPAPKPVTGADADAYFDALGSAAEEHQRNETRGQRIERANRESAQQHPCAYRRA